MNILTCGYDVKSVVVLLSLRTCCLLRAFVGIECGCAVVMGVVDVLQMRISERC